MQLQPQLMESAVNECWLSFKYQSAAKFHNGGKCQTLHNLPCESCWHGAADILRAKPLISPGKSKMCKNQGLGHGLVHQDHGDYRWFLHSDAILNEID